MIPSLLDSGPGSEEVLQDPVFYKYGVLARHTFVVELVGADTLDTIELSECRVIANRYRKVEDLFALLVFEGLTLATSKKSATLESVTYGLMKQKPCWARI